MRILITGASGMLGTNLIKLLPFDNIKGYNSQQLDITNYKQVNKILEKENPSIIIHTAAYTDVEGCELNRNKAYLINTVGTQNLVNYCISRNLLFIYISSTGIYGTKKTHEAYTEFDDVEPTTVHHKSKYEAEKIIQAHLNKFLILRTGWLFGGSIKHNKNFIYKRYLEAINKDKIYSNESQIGNPTYIKDLVNQIVLLINEKQYGIFNCVNEAKQISRYDYVKCIIEELNLDCIVKKTQKDSFKRIAKVSNNESAENYKLKLLNLNIMKDWKNSLAEYIDILKKEI